jgi:aspartyl-tRNA(Asn)/glutamyl-tRNA(Gln) amidotransferase subunit A
MDIKSLTIKEAQKLIHSKKLSCRELVSACLENIKEKNGSVNAYLEVFDDAFAQAEKEDERIRSGQDPKPLSGIPFAIKDNILIKGQIASAGSKILENYKAPYDAFVIQKLRDAGAIFLGRTNMDEFAMGSSTENSAFGPTKNPHDLERVPGGSSGGSAAALAMNGCLASLGSDTGGSIRQPAAFCGVVGLKPTYGSVSRNGLIAFGSSLDQIGPLAKTVEDAETIFNIIKGKDEKDSTSALATSHQPLATSKKTIGVLKYDKSGVDDEINKAIDDAIKVLKKTGHKIKEIEMPKLDYAMSCYYIIMFAESSSNLARFDGVKYGLHKDGEDLLDDYMETREAGFGKEVKRRIMLGTYVLSAGYYDAYYGKAQKVRQAIKNEFEKIFDLASGGVDAILTPTAPTPAFKIGEKTEDPVSMYLSDLFTVSANLAGVPAMSVPFGKTEEGLPFVASLSSKALASEEAKKGLPIGVQLTAPWFKEEILFKLGKELENK